MTCNNESLIHRISSEILARPRITLLDLSRKFQIERHRIEKAVRACKDVSFREYRTKLLAGIAVDLLLSDAECPEKTLADQLGYKSLSAFIRFMKTSTGYTPSQIRKYGGKSSQNATTAHFNTNIAHHIALTLKHDTNIKV
jgi:AraC-like DNA-binding protein